MCSRCKKMHWWATVGALEAVAAQHSDCLLFLDELAQIDPKTAGECTEMLANEQSKARTGVAIEVLPCLQKNLV